MSSLFKKMNSAINLNINKAEERVKSEKTELNKEALKNIIDIARPSVKIENILKYLDENITYTVEGENKEVKWLEGLDNSLDISEIILPYLDNIVLVHDERIKT